MFVYFIKAGDAVKIGIAQDVRQRVIEIQTGNPCKIEVLFSLFVIDVEEGRKIEAQIHETFKKTNLSGEWFQASSYLIDFIDNIRDNGWETWEKWIKERYEMSYRDILIALGHKIEEDIIVGNVVSLERLKDDLGGLVSEIYVAPSLPDNASAAIRNWVKKRQTPFVMKDIYCQLGITTRDGKKNVSKILKRLSEEGVIDFVEDECGIRRKRIS